MRKFLSFLILPLSLAVAPAAAHADSLTYNLILTATTPGSNVSGGTGSFTITGAPSPSGNSDFSTSNGGLTALSFSIGGDTFNLTNGIGHYGDVFFQNGNLISVIYNGGAFDKTVDFSLVAGALTYTFADFDNLGSNGEFEFSQGIISATVDPPAAPAVPEPSALLLFGTGALGLAGVVSRKLTA
jgi:PEP-CTERM motif